MKCQAARSYDRLYKLSLMKKKHVGSRWLVFLVRCDMKCGITSSYPLSPLLNRNINNASILSLNDVMCVSLE